MKELWNFFNAVISLLISGGIICAFILFIFILCNPVGYFYIIEITSNNYPQKFSYRGDCIDGLLFNNSFGSYNRIQVKGIDNYPVTCKILNKYKLIGGEK